VTDHPTDRVGVPAIEMTGVAASTLRDPDTMVAEGINWAVNAGDYWVMAGLHGSGKSDFLSAKVKSCCSEGGSPSSLGRKAPEFRTKELDGKV
jgi:ABC-type molybdenum transport system ATPase subunit/photorepair protein PhrA